VDRQLSSDDLDGDGDGPLSIESNAKGYLLTELDVVNDRFVKSWSMGEDIMGKRPGPNEAEILSKGFNGSRVGRKQLRYGVVQFGSETAKFSRRSPIDFLKNCVRYIFATLLKYQLRKHVAGFEILVALHKAVTQVPFCGFQIWGLSGQ
jgi:hypothetical protein